jgi:peptidoglycan/xylan/chitin deacetylase (PgdA/CDA1 family)
MLDLKTLPWQVLTRSRLLDRLIARSERSTAGQPNQLRVLLYHRIDEPMARPELDPTLLSATPAAFEAQMRHVARHYPVVSLEQVLSAVRRGPPLAPRSVLLTFDDAYQDFAENAWPVLRSARLRATLFVPTAYPDQPSRTFWWDRLYHAITTTARCRPMDTLMGRLTLDTLADRRQTFRRLKSRLKRIDHELASALVAALSDALEVAARPNPVMTWETLRRLSAEGVTLASHTRTHALLDRVEPDRVAEEVCGSMADLARETGPPPPVLAYPAGQTNPRVAGVLRDLGLVLGLTIRRGINDLANSDPLRLRRIAVGPHTNLLGLRVQLQPWR